MLFYDFCDSPAGIWRISADDRSVKAISNIRIDQRILPNPNQITNDCIAQLKEYFKGDREQFELELDLSQGTKFYRQVWHEVIKIPYGKTKSYLDIAKSIENPKAVRAVGMANGKNPFPIVIPCHRVIASNGNLQGYASGLEIKKILLKLENPKRFVEQLSLF